MLRIDPTLEIPLEEIQFTAIRAQGPGGQHVNKVATAIQLRFDICASSLPASCKAALLRLPDQRLTRDGAIVIKAQRSRSQERNREEALDRLAELIRAALKPRKPRQPTRPTRASRERRLDGKKRRGAAKRLRADIAD